MKPVQVKFKKLHPDAIIPTKATKGSACFDVYALKELWITQGENVLAETGLAVEITQGYFIEVRPRSGLAREGLILLNAPGTLDCDYRGEIKIALHFLYDKSRSTYHINKGDRIAQIRLVKEEPTEFVEVQELSPTERGEGGFGSTGK